MPDTPIRRVDIKFLEPEMLKWKDVFVMIAALSKAKDFAQLEKLLDGIPGISVEYMNPPPNVAPVLFTTHPVQLRFVFL